MDFKAIYPGVPPGIFASFPGVAHFISFEQICQYPRVPQGKVVNPPVTLGSYFPWLEPGEIKIPGVLFHNIIQFFKIVCSSFRKSYRIIHTKSLNCSPLPKLLSNIVFQCQCMSCCVRCCLGPDSSLRSPVRAEAGYGLRSLAGQYGRGGGG